MRIAYFTHSLASCWNHGNAHFLRGLLRELAARGHEVVAFEPADGWSRRNLVADHGEAPLRRISTLLPQVHVSTYDDGFDIARALHDADLAIVHEWTEPHLVAAIGARRKRQGRYVLLFHDTHHRLISDPGAIHALDLSGYDGVLAFGEALAEGYRRLGWGARAFVFHEAADTSLYRPRRHESPRTGAVWIGNWGDEERSDEISSFLLQPAADLQLPLDVYGVRYPASALTALEARGAKYHGWIANADVPDVFARHLMTVHIPRRAYREHLPGIPTIRVFEALACGIPLICAPWNDCEGLFRPGVDYLIARNSAEMRSCMHALVTDKELHAAVAQSGLDRILARHTCAHRADQLLSIVSSMQPELAGAA